MAPTPTTEMRVELQLSFDWFAPATFHGKRCISVYFEYAMKQDLETSSLTFTE